MSIASEIERLNGAKSAISAAISEKGVSVPDGTKLDGMAALIRSIPTGGSGTSIETCEVTVTFVDNFYYGVFPTYVMYTTVEDGKIVNSILDSVIVVSGTETINCVVGTSLYIGNQTKIDGSFITSDNITLNGTITYHEDVWEFVINSGPTATIEAVE